MPVRSPQTGEDAGTAKLCDEGPVKTGARGFHCRDEAAIVRPQSVHMPFATNVPWLSRSFRCGLAGVLSGAMVLAPLPALAAPAAAPAAAAPAAAAPTAAAAPAAAPAPATPAGGVIGLMRFTGDPDQASSMRSSVEGELSGAGYTVKGVALDIEAASAKVKCKGNPDDCVGKVAEWLIKGAKGGTTYNYLVYGSYTVDPTKATRIVIYDVAKKAKVGERTATGTPTDLILPLALPRAVAATLRDYQSPPPPATEAETKALTELDEPAKTPEEMRAEAEAIRRAEEGVDTGITESLDTSGVKVDLKADFKAFCRTGPRKPRVNKDDPKDLRPACKLGPRFGYFQTRAWVALGLTAGALVATGIFYSLGLAARKPYKDAVSALDASGLDPTNPLTSDEYTALASDVAGKGFTMRRRFVGGDVALLTTVLLGAVLGIIIYQDRTDAKDFIRQEKSLKSISKLKPANFRGGPVIGTQMQGISFGFDF